MQNAYVESFNGGMRDELLNETLFLKLGQAGLLPSCPSLTASWRQTEAVVHQINARLTA